MTRVLIVATVSAMLAVIYPCVIHRPVMICVPTGSYRAGRSLQLGVLGIAGLDRGLSRVMVTMIMHVMLSLSTLSERCRELRSRIPVYDAQPLEPLQEAQS